MIGYVTLGVRDLQKAEHFYDALFKVMSIQQVRKTDRMIFWSDGKGAALAIVIPYNNLPATSGNGTMIALSASSSDIVDKAYAKAIELGGGDEGEPGPRGEYMYSAYFRDPDGNKFLVFSPLPSPGK